MTRRGSLLLECVAACAALGVLGMLLLHAVNERAALRTLEQRAAQLDQAQDLLDAVRSGTMAELPSGWHWERASAAPGIEAVTLVLPDGRRLTTLRAKREAP